MRAAVYERFGGPIEVRPVPDPEVPGHAALIEVASSGLCRSDWHAWTGHDPSVALPHVPGHEFAGTVVAVGPNVRNWAPGARVTAPFSCGCGSCSFCEDGATNVCLDEYQPGFSGWGSFADLVVIPWADTNLVGLPDGVDFDAAAALGCRYMTAWWGLTGRAALRRGEWLAVHGAGGVGLSAVQIGAALGAKVVAVDIKPEALKLAQDLGATVTVLGTDPVREIREVTDGGAHVAVDALGSEATAANAIRSLRRRGRHVQIGLVIGEGRRLQIPMSRIISLELAVFGSHGMPVAAYPDLLERVSRGELDPGRLVTQRIGLDEVPDMLASMGDFPGTGITIARL